MGNIDLFHSRRDNYHRCVYWVRDERDAVGTPEQWILRNQSNGRFYAKTSSIKNNSMNVINNAWALDTNHITLETDDDIKAICRGSIVEYDGDLWLVENVQFEEHKKESEFSKHIHYRYYIAMVRG